MKPVASLSDDEFTHEVQRSLKALPDAPEAMQRAAIALWPAPGAAGVLKALAAATVATIQAVLSFDSWAGPAVATGMRSLRSPTRHLLFSAEGRDIDLRISPAADAFAMAGQILGPDETGTIELSAQDGGATQAFVSSLDALGEFRIDGIRRGTYLLTLHLGSDAIVLPPVEVGELGD